MNRFRALFLGFATAASAAALAAYNGAFDGPGKPASEAAAVKAAAPASETAKAAPEAVKTPDAPAETAKADTAAPQAQKAPEAPVETAKADPAPAQAGQTSDAPVEAAKADPAAAQTGKAPEAPVEVAKADPAAPADNAGTLAKTAPEPAAAAGPAAETAPPAAAIAPEFGLLRAEPDGSLLVAGKGAPNADIELVTGNTVLGAVKAGANGDFALVLNDPLKAGDYSMVLRTTNPDGTAATSVQTAIVAIPQDLTGEVLAMVEEPGKASRIITAPKAAEPVTPSVGTADTPAAAEAAKTADVAEAEAPASDPANEETVAAAAPEEPAAKIEEPAKIIIPLADVAVEAVEIEGNKIFVAGSAPAGATIRVYATEMLLGETTATENDRFLLEASRELAVGDYFIHADTIGKDGRLISRVTVPFTREAGENLAAVAAPQAEEKQAAEVTVQPPAPAEPAKAAEPETQAAAKAAEPAAAPETQMAAKSAEPEAAPSVEPETQAAAKAAEPQAEIAAKAAEPAEAPVTVAPALTKVDASVIIRRGDSLWRISRRVYGRGVRYSTIYLANKDKVRNPNRIWPGQVMMIPEKTSEGEAADMVEIEKRNKDAQPQ